LCRPGICHLWPPLHHAFNEDSSNCHAEQVVLRCYDFPSRLSGRLFVSLPGATLPSSVRVSQLAIALPESQRAGSLFSRRPDCRGQFSYPLSFCGQVCETQSSLPCCPSISAAMIGASSSVGASARAILTLRPASP
jgi:hypothetical protein